MKSIQTHILITNFHCLNPPGKICWFALLKLLSWIVSGEYCSSWERIKHSSIDNEREVLLSKNQMMPQFRSIIMKHFHYLNGPLVEGYLKTFLLFVKKVPLTKTHLLLTFKTLIFPFKWFKVLPFHEMKTERKINYLNWSFE